jgi:hypothetical protein
MLAAGGGGGGSAPKAAADKEERPRLLPLLQPPEGGKLIPHAAKERGGDGSISIRMNKRDGEPRACNY